MLGQGEFYVDLKSLTTLSGGDLVPEVEAEYVCIGSLQVWKSFHSCSLGIVLDVLF